MDKDINTLLTVKTTTNTEIKEKLTKIQTAQGKRLKTFRMEKGFNKKSTFARYIKSTHSTISAIEDYGREISDTVLDLIHFAFPDLNIKWLKTGALPKILTIGNEFKEQETIHEGRKIYNLKCPGCLEKDKEIEKLKTEIIELQKQIIEHLKEASG